MLLPDQPGQHPGHPRHTPPLPPLHHQGLCDDRVGNKFSQVFVRLFKSTRELSSSDLADLYLEEPGVPVSSLSFLVLIFMRKLT